MKITVFLFFITIKLSAQTKIIATYENRNNTDIPNTLEYILYIDTPNKKSLFIRNANLDTLKGSYYKKADGTFQGKFKQSVLNTYLTDYKENKIFSLENLRGKAYLVDEKLNTLSWKITNEEKTISKIKVKKAETTFRGRKYIAWFSEKYPIPFGPWKLHGLPGLIFEAYDETKRYNYTLKTIKSENFDNNIFDLNGKPAQKINLKNYVNKVDNGAKEMLAKLPRGIDKSEYESTRKGKKELKYEWEK